MIADREESILDRQYSNSERNLAAALREFRLRAGLTQEELADLSGLSVRTIGNLERARSARPHRQSVDVLARALGLSGPEHETLRRAARSRTVPPAPPGETAAPYRSVIQLPFETVDLVGRDDTIARVIREADERRKASPTHATITAFTGMAGVGKTALAVHLGHQLNGQYPEGQIFLSLTARGQRELTPAEGLRRLLRALDVAPEDIPETLQERETLFRDRVSRRRIVIILDGAASEAQVTSLLPGACPCHVLITSRTRLAGLSKALHIELKELDMRSSLELLERTAGAARVLEEPQAALDLAALCHGLPLALRIVGARIAARPQRRLTDLVRRMSREGCLLDELEYRDMSVRAALLPSYARLDFAARDLLHQLSLRDLPASSLSQVASMSGRPLWQAEKAVEQLIDLRLLEEVRTGDGRQRYRLHGLVRAYAREQAGRVGLLDLSIPGALPGSAPCVDRR
ncbi:helix-turn-helix domain-containing protein [Nonomuraea sp. NPDC049141]|uniref:helix-turn-helix domain-containing protein n=1 Tax=Nonomuraea sp. NPDC049141 TaxID=3155500 RepID=UPI0033DBA9EA